MKNKKTYLLSCFGVLLLVISFILLPLDVTAEETKSEALSFTMSIVPPANQINSSANYFDLKVSPNEEQELKVIVSNSGQTNKKIRVTPTTAVTNQNGAIDYSIQEEGYQYDKTLKYVMTDLISAPQTTEVAPGESKELIFQLKAPNDSFDGLILGGFVADLPDEKEMATNNSGVKIVNKFQVVKAIMIRQTSDKVKPDLTLNDVKPNLVGYRTAVTANLQNVKPTMVGEMKVVAEVTKKGSKKVIKKETNEGLEMAPNSNFDFPIMWNNQPLEAGTYTIGLVINSREDVWRFTKDFTVTKDESRKLNEEAVELEETGGMPFWVYVLIGLLLIVIALLIIALTQKKKKD